MSDPPLAVRRVSEHGPLGPREPKEQPRLSTSSISQQWVGDHTEEWFRGRGPLAMAVVAEMKAAGVHVFAGGLDEEDGPVYSADTTSGTLMITHGPYVETNEFLGGFAVVDVADDEAATMWAGKIAEACGWPHEVRRFQAAASGKVTPPSRHLDRTRIPRSAHSRGESFPQGTAQPMLTCRTKSWPRPTDDQSASRVGSRFDSQDAEPRLPQWSPTRRPSFAVADGSDRGGGLTRACPGRGPSRTSGLRRAPR